VTDREKYDALAAELKAAWETATAAARAGEEKLREIFP
jgi:hypothetical protein